MSILLAVTAVAAVVWFGWLPSYRPGLRPGERYGIDVSHHQGSIQWHRVAADGIRFAYIKATEGRDFFDPRFRDNWEGAGAAGLDRGAYHFFTLCSPAEQQADHFLQVLPDDRSGVLPPAVDLELAGNCTARPPDRSLRRGLTRFVRMVEGATGRRLLLYIGEDFRERYPLAASLDRHTWDLSFLRRPEGSRWVVWQVMSYAHVDGIDGDVGLDVGRALRAET